MQVSDALSLMLYRCRAEDARKMLNWEEATAGPGPGKLAIFAHVWNTTYRNCKQWQTIALSFKQYPSGNSSLLIAVMGPGNDKDAANGTPQDQSDTPTTIPAASSSSTQKNESDNIVEKYKKLKRRFFELEEVRISWLCSRMIMLLMLVRNIRKRAANYRDQVNGMCGYGKNESTLLSVCLQRANLTDFHSMLLERIMELEAQPQFKANGGDLISSTLDQPPSSAFPRSLLTARARSSFINNLRQAVEDDGVTTSTDTTVPPRHIGPPADERPAKRARTLNGESQDATASPGPNGSTTPRLHVQTPVAPGSPVSDSSHPTYSHPPVPPPNPYDRPLTPPTPLADHFLPQGGIIRPSPITEDAPMQIDTTRTSPPIPPQQPGIGALGTAPEKPPEDASAVEQSISTSLPVSASRGETATEPDPAPAPTRRSTRARRPVNYNDDEPTASPSKNEKVPPARKTRAAAKASNPEASGASTSSSNPTPGAASSTSGSASVQTPTPTPMHNINPILMGATGATTGNGSVPSTSISPPAPSPMGINPYSVYYPTPSATVTPAHPFPYSYYYMPGSGLMPPGMMPPGVFPTGPPMPSHPAASQSPPQQRPTPESQRQARPKRLKAHTVTSKSYSIPMVPRDKGGRPMLPLNVGIMTVISLGEVCMREHFHTERYIFPVGYEVTRSVLPRYLL